MCINKTAAFFHTVKADYSEALTLYQTALAINEQLYGTEHPVIVASCQHLAVLYKTIAIHDFDYTCYSNSLALYQRALAIQQKTVGENHPAVANSFQCLAELYFAQRADVNALRFFQKALEMRECLLGENHPDVAESLNGLASLYETQGDFHSAIVLSERAAIRLIFCCLRARHNRNLAKTDEDGAAQKLWDKAARQPPPGQIEFVPEANGGRKARKVCQGLYAQAQRRARIGSDGGPGMRGQPAAGRKGH